MSRIATILALLSITAPVFAGGFCYPVHRGYSAPVYKAPIYKAPYVAPHYNQEQVLNIIIKPVAYPLADQGKDFFSYSLQDEISPFDVGALAEGLNVTAQQSIATADKLADTIQTVSAQKLAADTAARQFILKREVAKSVGGAVRDAVVQALQAADSPTVIDQSVTVNNPPAEIEADAFAGDGPDAVLKASCVQCHHSAAKDTDLDLTGGWESLSGDQRTVIGERVTTLDPELRMPRGKDLPFAQRRLLIE